MLDLNIDYLQSTQVCVSYNTVVYSEKSHLENSQFRASMGKKEIHMRLLSIVNVNQNVAQMLNNIVNFLNPFSTSEAFGNF